MSPKKNKSFSSIINHIQPEMQRVRDLISDSINDCHYSIKPLVKPFIQSRGKMLRPALVLLSARACGKLTDKHIRTAATLQMIHNATLLHDDVIDKGHVRRGKPTVNAIYGNESAVLFGDFFLTCVFKMITGLDSKITKLIADTASDTCQGELRQVLSKKYWQMNESQYMEIIAGKTAALFSCCCQTGAMLSNADEKTECHFKNYGNFIGIAFQITDDLLDIVGQTSQTGKTTGRDVESKKFTLPVIHHFSKKNNSEKQRLIEKIENNEIDNVTFSRFLNETQSISYASSMAQEYSQKAIVELKNLTESEDKKSLIEIGLFSTNRTH